jgi:protocatechuate 3,4-dioxygenase alpha subunit
MSATPSQTVGPFFRLGLCVKPNEEVVWPGTLGAVQIRGLVLDGEGEPVPDALVETWQAGPDGEYRDGFGWGRSGTDDDGVFRFVTVKPGRVDRQAPHLVVLVFARGLLKPVLTRMYFPDEAGANEADPVLRAIGDGALRSTLVAEPDGEGGLRFDVRLQGDRQTAFFAL